MPSGPPYLHEFWQDDSNAWAFLKTNFDEVENGMISPKDPKHIPTFVEWRAIEYLILEWDWGYKGPV
jgi:hypothetical protein